MPPPQALETVIGPAMVPMDWVPTPNDRAYGVAKGLREGEINREATDFRKWYRDKRVLVRCPSAAFTRWLDKLCEFDRIDGRIPAAPTGAQDMAPMAILNARTIWVAQVDTRFAALSN